MFTRRLLLLAGIIAAAMLPPLAQTARLTLTQAEPLRAQAREKLVLSRPLGTTRGRILDRQGRVLAADRPAYDVALDYHVLTGDWAFTRAAARARQQAGSGWGELSPLERVRLAERFLPEYELELDAGWRHLAELTGVPRDELDQRRDRVVAQVAERAAAVALRRLDERARRALTRSGEVALDLSMADVAGPIAEQRQPHVIVPGIGDELAMRLLPLADPDDGTPAGRRLARAAAESGARVIPGLRLLDASQREYPLETLAVSVDRALFPGPIRGVRRGESATGPDPVTIRVEGVATHLVGLMRSTPGYTADDARARRARLDAMGVDAAQPDAGAYQPGDRAGRSGVERGLEFELRGLRGRVTDRLDTGQSRRDEPVPGADVRLTIDAVLQARVQALFDPSLGLAVVQPWHNNTAVAPGSVLAGAAVVLDVDSADIIACVSSPGYTRAGLAAGDASIFADPLTSAGVNRALAKPYPPGSIVKPLMWCAAVSWAGVDPTLRVACRGHYFENQPRTLQCWIFKQFRTTHAEQYGEDLSAPDALAASCNIFFYHLGRVMGPQRVIDAYARLGVGPASRGVLHPALALDESFEGFAGDRADAAKTTAGEAMLMAIGQGPVAWTPLHAADAFATLARGGVRVLPRLHAAERARIDDLGFSPAAVASAMEGLRRSSVDERGTAHHLSWIDAQGQTVREPILTAPGVWVWAKSGTADAPALLAPDDVGADAAAGAGGETARRVLRDGDHSWFVCLVGPAGDRPRYAVAVVVDYGGSGGRVAGPLANQIIIALKSEGYL